MESRAQLITASKKRFNSSRIFSLATTILLSLTTTVLCVGFLMRYEVDSEVSSMSSIPYWKEELTPEQQLWYDEAIEELKVALNKNWAKQRARNVIIFVASGMDADALAAARAADNSTMPQPPLSWERFPHLARLKNSCSLTDICDPFTVATAFFSGARPQFRVGGLDGSVAHRDCAAAQSASAQLKSVLKQAQERGLRTGFVTNRRITGPGMASLYAHTPSTAWECDASMPPAAVAAGCRDVAQQLLRCATGRALNVVMGGGRQTLISHVPVTEWDPIDEAVCNSQDGRNVLRDWRMLHLRQRRRFEVLQNNYELQTLNGSTVDHVLGVFANGDLHPVYKPHVQRDLTPQLDVMVNKSLEVLRRRERGYLLVVEAGVQPQDNLQEQVEALQHFNAAVQQACKMSSAQNTLILVAFTNGAYVRNVVDVSAEIDTMPKNIDFETLAEENDDDDRLFHIPADTVVYANGPRAYLLHGVHEETYMSYVVSYSLAMGQFADL